MQILSALLAEEIIQGIDHKYNIIKVINTIAEGVPITIPKMCVFVEMEYDDEDIKQDNRITIDFINRDGKPVAPFTTVFVKCAPVPPFGNRRMFVLHVFKSVDFFSWGEYFLDLAWNGHPVRRMSLHVHPPIS